MLLLILLGWVYFLRDVDISDDSSDDLYLDKKGSTPNRNDRKKQLKASKLLPWPLCDKN